MKTIEVVAAIIRKDDRIFATERGYGEWKDWWEFPGGKVEPGESPEQALRREILEELDTEVSVDKYLTTIDWDYPKFHLTMHCYMCSLLSDALHLNEHEAARWLGADDLRSVRWLPADDQLLPLIKKELESGVDAVGGRMPLIVVTPLWDVERSSVWMLPDYLDGISGAGGVPVVLPLDASAAAIETAVARCDGFLFTGGPDVSPTLHGTEDADGKAFTCPPRDALEAPLLKRVVAAGKPVLGICRGLQLINAVLGGTLYLDLPTQHPSPIVHRQAKPYGRPTHDVLLSGPLRELMGTDRLPVNTLHHQAVRELAPGLEPMAISPDGLVEAFRKVDYGFLWAVQWHPEYLFRDDPYSRRIFSRFVEECK